MEYYIVVNGKVVGPLSSDELHGYKIQSDTFVRSSDMDDFKEAHEIPEFRALFNFKPEPVLPQYFASFDQRLLASVIDYFLITLIFVFLVLLGFIFTEEAEKRKQLLIWSVPLIILTKFGYEVFADCSKTQGSIGKKLLQIKVTKIDGTPISLSQSFYRNSAKLLSTITFFIGYLYSFLNKRNQCFHDLLADTLVVKDRLI